MYAKKLYMCRSNIYLRSLCLQGWSLYAESLGRNLALSGDPFDEFGLLYSELYETSRVMVDTGIHALGFAVYSYYIQSSKLLIFLGSFLLH